MDFSLCLLFGVRIGFYGLDAIKCVEWILAVVN